MSARYIVTFFYCLLFSTTPLLANSPQDMVKIISSNENEIVLSITSYAELSVINENGISFTELSVPNEGIVGLVGMPNLPAITRVLTFPTDGELHIEVISDETVEIDLGSPIASFSVDDNIEVNADYQLVDGSLFPANIVEVGERQLFRGHRLFPVKIFPYQYDQKSNKLIHHKEITLSIRFEATDDPKLEQSGYLIPKPMTIDTYRFLNALTLNGPERDDHGASLPRGGYLIATTFTERQVSDHVERLADWKRACGHRVDILYGVDSRDITLGSRSEFKRDEIEARYDEWDPPLEFLCVIGVYAEQPRNTDVTYGCFDGANDHVPEVAVGRLGATSVAQAEKVIGRALSYQQEPWIEEMDWFNRAGAFAHPVGRTHTWAIDHAITWIAEAERRSGFSDVEWWSRDGGNGHPDNWLRDGLSIHFERGLNRSVPNFSNFEGNPMWISSGGGHVPRFVDDHWAYGGNNPTGPSVMTGTGHNPSTPSCNTIIGGMARGLLIDKLPLAWARAFALLMLDYSGTGSWTQFATEYRVMGEPGQKAWIGAPIIPDVTHTDFMVIGQNRIEVTVTDSDNDESISHALVTIIQPGELISHGITDENGVCVLTFSEEIDEDVILSVTKDGLLPYQAEIEVRESHLFVRAFISEIDDEENGNGDGILNPGETVEIFITAENLSDDEDSDGVTGVLSVNSSWLTIDEEEFDLGEIEHSSQVQLEGGISITLGSSAPENADLQLSIILSSGESNWISSLELEVEGADLNFSEIVGGAVVDPEMAELEIIISNDGNYESAAMGAELVSVSQWVQIIRANAVFEVIESGDTGGFSGEPFVINPSPLAPPGLVVPMMVLIRANEDDIPDTIVFDLQIDTPRESSPNGPDAYGYICFDDTDDYWEQAPVYDWIEINPENRDADFEGEEVPGRLVEQYTAEVELPFEFQFYGESYNHITISENGFIAMGEGLEDLKQYENFPLDMMINGSFGMIAPYWDDLDVTRGESNIYTHFVEDEHLFIIQWEDMRFKFNGGDRRLTFEVILMDPEFFPVESGDGKILIQYKGVPNPLRGEVPTYFSAGICSPDGTTGIGYAYGNDYPVCSAEIENQRALLFTTSPEAPRGVIYGNVRDVASGDPMEDAFIVTSYGQVAFTDEDGDWIISDAWVLPFDVKAGKQGWNDSTLTEFEMEEGDTLEINFALLNPEFVPSTWNLSYMLDPDTQTELEFSVHNTGNGPLDWAVDRRLFGGANAEPWEFRRSIMAGELVDDPRLYGVLFINNQFYVSGRNDNDPHIYIFNVDGEPIDSFSQPGDDNTGMKDLAYDGELIWGTVRNTIYGMTLEGEVVTQIDSPHNTTTLITWDSDREVLWVGGTVNNPVAVNREGNQIDGLEVDRNDMRIYGLAYFPDDPDHAPLYILHKMGDESYQTLIKYNIETEETIFVAHLELEAGGSPGGAYITNTYDVYSWVFVSITNDADRDRIDIHQIEARKDWFSLDLQTDEGRTEALSGQLQTDETMEFILTLDATSLPETLFQAELFFSHNADSGIGHILIDLDVIGNVAPDPFGLAEPQNGDTLTTSVVDFSWNPSRDPNADDNLRYVLWTEHGLDARAISLIDTSISIDLDSVWNETDYAQPVNWWVHAIAGDDTIECDERFNFLLDINSLGDDERQNPYVFNLNSVYPNPFNGRATISFELANSSYTSLTVTDILGREAAVLHQGVLEAGKYNAMWDARQFSTGVYLIKLETADNRMIKKVLYMK